MISRGIAAFLGGFTILNLIGSLLSPGFDANIWWIDCSGLPRPIALFVLWLGGIALLVFAIKPPGRTGVTHDCGNSPALFRFARPEIAKTRSDESAALGMHACRRDAGCRFAFSRFFDAQKHLAHQGRALPDGRRASLQLALLLPIGLLAVVAIANSVRFYRLLHHHRIATGVPVPFSAIIFAALALIGWRIMRPSRRQVHPRGRRIMALTLAACIVGFPLAQMYFFGHTDYRRKADVIVVFGARAHADGSPSGVLADRVRMGCELYHEGLARRIIFSGGPGDGEISEPQAMRRMALRLGVADADIVMDEGGVNTDATVRNTTALFRESHVHRVLAVSHSYHLARVKMSYLQAGWNVYTIPAREDCGLPGGGRFLMFREMIAMGVYYFHPLHLR